MFLLILLIAPAAGAVLAIIFRERNLRKISCDYARECVYTARLSQGIFCAKARRGLTKTRGAGLFASLVFVAH